eukprot:sb/3473959/
MGYDITYCTSVWFTELPVQPPAEVEKIWTIAKTETGFIIICNGVEVLNYLFADSSESDCVTTWDGDVVEQIVFAEFYFRPASDFYRAGKVPNLMQIILGGLMVRLVDMHLLRFRMDSCGAGGDNTLGPRGNTSPDKDELDIGQW